MRDAENEQTVATAVPQRIRTALPENQPQDLLQGIGRAGVYQPEHGRGDAGRQKGSESEGRNGKESSGQNGERKKGGRRNTGTDKHT